MLNYFSSLRGFSRSWFFFLFSVLSASTAVAGEYQILPNGEFEAEQPLRWSRGDPALVDFVEEDGNRFCRITLVEKKAAIIEQDHPLDPAWRSLDFSVRIRAEDVKTGDQNWQTGQFQFLLKDKDDKVVGGYNRLLVDADTDGWITLERKGLPVHESAVKVVAQIGVWGASGTFDFDDVKILAATKPARPTTHVPATFVPKGPVTNKTYYVSPAGSDANDGTTVDTPFRTIQKAADVMQAGDTCLIRAGVYRETVHPANSGQDGAPITFQPYEGEKVVISGAEPITDWEKVADGLYKAPMPADFFVSAHNQADQVFLDGRMMVLAQWPNTTLTISEPAKAVASEFVSKTRNENTNMTTGVVRDTNLAAMGDGYGVGAEIFFQPNHGGWSWAFTGKVTKQAGGELTFQSRSNAGQDFKQSQYHENSRYILYNSRQLLDAPGEWYHDKDAGELYLIPLEGMDPNTRRAEAKKREYGFVLDDRAFITIQNLHFFACMITTDTAAGGSGQGYDKAGKTIYPWRGRGTFAKSHHVVIDGIRADYLSHFTDRSGHFFMQWGQGTGIVLSGQDHVLKNSALRFSAGNGVTVLGARNKVLNNIIEDVNYAAVDCSGINTGGAATTVDHEIGHNTIRRCGRSGITPRLLKNSDPTTALVARIHHNDISEFMMQDWDGGAIYNVGNMEFTRIDHNWCHDAWPNVDNIPGVGAFTVGGVYLDYGSNTIVDHNVTWNVEWGIHLQAHDNDKPGANIIVYNNTVGVTAFGSPPPGYGPFGIWVNNKESKHAGSVVANNLIYCRPPTKNYRPLPEEGERKKDWTVFANWRWDGVVESETDPKFVDPDGPIYMPAADSPVVDAGTPVPTYERDGVTLPPFSDAEESTPDAGAYETGQSAWKAGADFTAKR